MSIFMSYRDKDKTLPPYMSNAYETMEKIKHLLAVMETLTTEYPLDAMTVVKANVLLSFTRQAEEIRFLYDQLLSGLRNPSQARKRQINLDKLLVQRDYSGDTYKLTRLFLQMNLGEDQTLGGLEDFCSQHTSEEFRGLIRQSGIYMKEQQIRSGALGGVRLRLTRTFSPLIVKNTEVERVLELVLDCLRSNGLNFNFKEDS
jgi:hypothetical protein